MTKRVTKRMWLEAHGFIVGNRDERINTAFRGQFMVIQPHDETSLPTEDAKNGPWAVVGDNLDELIEQTHNHFCEE